MMKKMSYDEIQAFYNELESKRLKIKQDLEINPSKYNGMSDEAKEWIKGYRNFKDIKRPKHAIGWLFRDIEKVEETEIVLDALKATKKPKLVEIASKYAEVKPTIPIKIEEKMAIAAVILSNTRENAKYALGGDIKPDKYPSTVFVTAVKELNKIKKRYKKLSAREIKAMRKYKNISGINMWALYRSFSDLCRSLKPRDADWLLSTGSFASEDRRKFVLEHQREVIELFESHPQLEFARSQKLGKLK